MKSGDWMERNRKIRIFKSLIAVVTSFIILVSSISHPDFCKTISENLSCNREVSAYVDTEHLTGEVSISSLEALYQFAKNYHDNPNSYQYKNLVIGMNEAIIISPTREINGTTYTWYPIGTSNKPFAGKITINLGQGNTQNIEVNEPLFDYIYDSVDIVNINDDQTAEGYEPSQIINLVRNNDVSSGDTKPLFANKVVHNTDSQVTSAPSTWHFATGGTGSYSGIIGTVGTELDNTVVSLDLTINNSSSTIQADGNAGFVCGTIKNGATVNVELNSASTETVTDVTSDNGNAGFYVGEMYQGSTLNVIRNSVMDASDAGRTITGKTYAGGLVGKNDQGTVVIKNTAEGAEEVYGALGTIVASDGAAGGVFGYYKITSDYNGFSPSNYTSTTGCTLNGKTAGGLVGVLEADGIDVSYSGADSSHKVNVVSTLEGNHTNYGGIIGTYSNTDLTKTLAIEHVNATMNGSYATNYGGAVGSIGGDSAVYVYVDDFSLTSTGSVGSCSYFGGVLGTAGSNGSLIDVGSITITSTNRYKGGGVLGRLRNGVLRISGVTNLSGANANAGGQVVGEVNNGLVYALGSGNDAASSTYGNGWRLVRSSTDVEVDDIGTWGEVVRINDIENGIITYDSSAHTVTVASAVTDMKSASDFVRTALNMQLNDGNKGALRFDSGSNRTALLADTSLTIFGTINLSGTGITGFMRDGSTSSTNDDTEIKYFTGKLSKGEPGEEEDDADAIIQLAVGERYGVLSNGTAVTDGKGRGTIIRHRFNGLFARTGDGATIENITVDGIINVRSRVADTNVGGVIAYVKDAVTLTSVNATETINYHYPNAESTSGQYIGGVIGKTNCNAGKKVTIEGTSSTKATIAPTINVTGTCLDNGTTEVNQCIGGAIGYISSTSGTVASQTETEVKYVNLSANIDASGASAATNISMAGLIADIAWNGTDTRKLTISDIDVTNTIVKNKATNTTGGILGYRWFGTDVTFENIALISDNEINTPSKYIGGLVYKATGNWVINSLGIDIDDIAFKNGNAIASPTGLGIILHDGYYSNSGIYMEFMAEDSFALESGLSYIPDMTGSKKLYDELCTCLADSTEHILTNDTAGVISYYTSGGVYSSAEETKNSYDNIYNTTVVNNRSRYYYNADIESYTSNSSDAGYKLLYWSLNRYAAANIKRCFTNPFTGDVLSGTFDLKNISYYPIDISKNVSLGDSTIVFYNSQIEDSETATDTKRSTRDGESQHYMMHMGLFRNVSSTITTTGNIRMYGTVGVDSTYSGTLINGTLTGTLNTATAKNFYLGYYDNDNGESYPLQLSSNSRYLLINKIGDKAVLNLNGLWVTANVYDTTDGNTYASSLIGDVQGTGINLTFNNIKIDARNKEGVSITGSLYGTTKSIFSNATLLNKYDVDSTSVAVYNFSQAEDWGSKTNTTKSNRSSGGKVTFGRELTDSVEYENEENRYYEDGENGNYIAPITYPGKYDATTAPLGSAYDFSSDYLPYVRYFTSDTTKVSNPPTATYTLREIKVNVVPSDLTEGCGAYDHPYKITTAKQLSAVSIMLDHPKTDGTDLIPNIMLPETNDGTHWCCSGSTGSGASETNTNECLLFTYDTSLGKYKHEHSSGTVYWEINDVRKYLASAYYQIGNSIELGTTFTGLGAFDKEYAFKGVIVGLNNNITITNKTTVPFIKVSNGSVVKNIKIDINNTGTYGPSGSNSTIFNYSSNALVYGGVIGKIMGGDNIIDNVSVTYSNNGYIKTRDSYLMCVGGYVGIIVNGGLVFRNMTPNSFTNKSSFKVNSAGASNAANWVLDEDNTTAHSHLYVNPYVGRVINGYAINETTEYSGDTDTYTLDNGTKNYQIADVIAEVSEDASITDKPHKLYYDTKVTSNDRVNIPDGQALFILSLITQSGAGTATSADDAYAYAIGYDGTNHYGHVSGVDTSAYSVATHLADYDEVGKIKYSQKTTGDYKVAIKDKYNDSSAVPYIIYHYTKASSGTYPARKMTGATDFMKLSTAGGTYNLPKSFRGIGSICDGLPGASKTTPADNNFYQMHIYGFEGNGSTINEQIIFNTYVNDSDNYANKVYGKDNINLGMGLFNVLIQKRYSNSTTYKLDEGYYIGNFKLTGQVAVNEYDSNGAIQAGAFSNDTNSPARNRYSVGGLTAGILPNSYVNLYNLDLDALDIKGTSFVGGYIGRNNITEYDAQSGSGASNIYLNGCDATDTVVNGSTGCCGGVLGGSISGYPSIYVNTAEVKTGDDHEKGADNYYKTTMELSMTNTSAIKQSGIGGIIGTLRNGYDVKLWVNNVTIKGCGTNKGFINNTNTATTKNQWFQGAGGLFGFVRKADSIIVTNCEIEDLNIKAPYAGGLFGNIDFYDDNPNYGTSPVIKIANCKIKSSDSSAFSIVGIKGAGGITGQFTSSKAYDKTVAGYKGDTYSYDVDGCEVSGYIISQTGTANELCGAGGLFGFARATYVSSSDYKMRTVVNTSVHDCIIKADGSQTNHGMGAVIGCVPTIDSSTSNSGTVVIDDSGTAKSTAKACGNVGSYNVACYNNSFAYNGSSTSAKVGNFVGQSNSSIFKVVGFTRKNNKLGDVALTADYGGDVDSSSYIIDADYMNISIGNNHGNAMAVGFDNGTNVGEGAAKNYFPYVTVSPKTSMGGSNFLTGDGINIIGMESVVNNESITNDVPIAKLIVNENKGTVADNRVAYKTVGNSDINTVEELLTRGEDTSNDYDIKVTTYFREMGVPTGYEGSDFPIIAINRAEYNYNSYINAYIRTLTNTTDTYTADVAGKYSISIYPCQCINGVYQKVSGTTGFQRNANGNYIMDDTQADSIAGNNQISMIDVSFLDPTDASKTAYHLYIPVLTKKLLKFNFSSTALQGTEYEKGVYEAKIPGNWGGISKLGAGFDSWQTIYAKFDYTKEEMDEFLKTGKGLDWNTSKTLQFKYNSNKSLATSTEYVLLDNNYNVDKEYYKTKAAADTNTDSLGNKYDVISFGEFAGFSPQKLMHIAADKIEYTPDNNGAYVMCSKNDATVIAYDGNGDEVYFKAGTSGTLYTLTVKSGETISETYYLSMYTYGKDNVITATTHDTYGLTVECPMTFTSNIVTCQRNAAKNTNIYLGDFLEQTLTISEINDNAKITTDNHVINATLTSTISFAGDSKVYFNENLAGEKLYQNFYLYLNRYDEQGNISDDCTIKGNPVYTYTRTVGGSQYGAVASGGVDRLAPYFYVEPVEIEVDYTYGQNWSSVQTAVIALDFGTNEAKLIEEFPARVKSTNDYRGIGLDASSKIDFAETRVKYSNNVKDATDPPNKRYYIDRTSQNGVLTLTALDQPEYDGYDAYGEQSKNKSGLGINGKYIETGSEFADMGYLEHIDVGLDYDITNLPDEVLTDGGYNLDFVITLEQKENSNSSPGYVYTPVNIEDLSGTDNTGYLDNFEFMDKSDSPLTLTSARSGEQQDGYLYYTYRMPLSTNRNNWTIKYNDNGGQKHFTSNLSFDVKTEDLLKAIDGYKYSNYKLKVTATISKGSTAYSSEDHVVYTNARVNAEYVVGTN